MLAAILNNELKRSVIVESSSCGDLSDGSDLASARHSFCGNHGAAGDAEARDQVLPLAPLPGRGVSELRFFAPNSELQRPPPATDTPSFPSGASFTHRVRGVNVHRFT